MVRYQVDVNDFLVVVIKSHRNLLILNKCRFKTMTSKEVEPLGSQSPKMIDFRVIAATNRDLEELVREDYFRRDLFYRLNVISLQLPPLREIREDIPVLAEHFLMKLRSRVSSSVSEITPEVMEIFRAYAWPGNVRALALCQGSTIKPEHLPESIVRAQARSAPRRPEWHLQDDLLPLAVSHAEREQLLEALRKTGGNRTEAAALLNIHRTTLYFRLKKYGVSIKEIGIRRKS